MIVNGNFVVAVVLKYVNNAGIITERTITCLKRFAIDSTAVVKERDVCKCA